MPKDKDKFKNTQRPDPALTGSGMARRAADALKKRRKGIEKMIGDDLQPPSRPRQR